MARVLGWGSALDLVWGSGWGSVMALALDPALASMLV
jgi:hypothetical protein